MHRHEIQRRIGIAAVDVLVLWVREADQGDIQPEVRLAAGRVERAMRGAERFVPVRSDRELELDESYQKAMRRVCRRIGRTPDHEYHLEGYAVSALTVLEEVYDALRTRMDVRERIAWVDLIKAMQAFLETVDPSLSGPEIEPGAALGEVMAGAAVGAG